MTTTTGTSATTTSVPSPFHVALATLPSVSPLFCVPCFCQAHRRHQRRSKSPIFPENALQLTLDADGYPGSSPAPSTPGFSGSDSLPSTSYTPAPPAREPPAHEPATDDVAGPLRPGHVRFHTRVRIASGLRSQSYITRVPSASTLTPPAGRTPRERLLHRASSSSILDGSIPASPASSVSVAIRPAEPAEAPRGSYSERLLELAQRRERMQLPGTPAPPRRRPIPVGERTPLIGARTGRRYIPRRRSSGEDVDERDAQFISTLRGGWTDLRVCVARFSHTSTALLMLLQWWWWKASESASYCCGRDESDEELE
jgi:hypothetical protein